MAQQDTSENSLPQNIRLEFGFGILGNSEDDHSFFTPFLLHGGYRFGKNEVGIRLVKGKEFRICFGDCGRKADKLRDINLLYGRIWQWKRLEGVFFSGISFTKIKRFDVYNQHTNMYSDLTTNTIGLPLGTNIYFKFSEGFGIGLGSYYSIGKSVTGGGTLSFLYLLNS